MRDDGSTATVSLMLTIRKPLEDEDSAKGMPAAEDVASVDLQTSPEGKLLELPKLVPARQVPVAHLHCKPLRFKEGPA